MSCETCEFSSNCVSAKGTLNGALAEDGSLIYADTSSCGLSVGKICKEELESDYPEFVQRLSECRGMIEEVVEVPRAWPLGRLGMVKAVEVERCGATTATELQQIATMSRERARIN